MDRPLLDPGWGDLPLESLLTSCRKLVEDADLPTVRRWREGGGKVVGHFQVYFPEELAHAAGLLPVKVRGAPIEPRIADARFGSYLCSILKTSLELALSGRLELDLFVSHPICDAARNLAAIWGRNADYPCQILYLPQNANSRHAAGYLTEEYQRLIKDLEAVGRPITPEALRSSIRLFNENRRLLRELYRIKRETPWKISLYELYPLVALAGLITREEHNVLLTHAMALIEARDTRPQDKIRTVYVGGFCEQPPLDLLRVVCQFCYVVEDDLLIGLRYLTEDVPTGDDPLHDLAEAYLEKSSFSPVQHDLRKPKERMLQEWVAASEATAVIVTAAKMCEPGLEEQVTYTELLEGAGIPYFISEFEESMVSFEHLEMQLETFAETLLFA